MKKASVFSNLIWRFAERCGAQVVSFIVSIILARILEPEAYGTVALITVFTTIFQVFVDSGLGNALIQKKDADDLDFSTVFYANIVFCTVLYAGLYFAAPAIARFYDNLTLVPYIRVLSLTVLISGVKNVQQAYVSRHMLFRKFFFSTLGGTITAGIIGIAMALYGFGLWALVAQQVINLAIDSVILWCTVKWRPKKCFSLNRLKGLLSYGWKLLVSGLLNTLYGDLRQLLIGKIYTSADLAYYNKGNSFPGVIVTNVNSSIDSVLLSAMSNEQDNVTRVRDMTRRAIKTSTYIMAPLMVGLAFTGTSVVKLLLTEKWRPCVLYLRVFCFAYIFSPIHTANLNAIKAMGRSDIFLKLEVVKKVFGLTLLLIVINISVEAMAYSILFADIIGQIINSWPNKKLLHYGYLEQIKDIFPNIALALFMGLIIWSVELFGWGVIPTLCVQIVLGAVIYLAGSVVTKNDSFQYVWNLVKPMLHKFLHKK